MLQPAVMRTGSDLLRISLRGALLLVALGAPARGNEDLSPVAGSEGGLRASGAIPAPSETPLIEAIRESLFGDVYAEGRWRPLSLGSFFSEGWLESWAVAPAGRDGLTPRHGWLGAFNGVFYRLWSAELNFTRDVRAPNRGNRYEATASVFLPLSRRFEVLIADPFVVAGPTADPRRGYLDRTGDLVVAPRFLLAESVSTSHVLAVEIRTPTGSAATGGGITALSPRYEFWTNPGGPWVVRGSASIDEPISGVPRPGRTTFVGGLAIGRYFTPHDMLFGDLAVYAACNFSVPLDDTAATGTVVTAGPGTRFHLGANYYLLNYWAFPVTGPHPEEFSVQGAIVKIF